MAVHILCQQIPCYFSPCLSLTLQAYQFHWRILSASAVKRKHFLLFPLPVHACFIYVHHPLSWPKLPFLGTLPALSTLKSETEEMNIRSRPVPVLRLEPSDGSLTHCCPGETHHHPGRSHIVHPINRENGLPYEVLEVFGRYVNFLLLSTDNFVCRFPKYLSVCGGKEGRLSP